MDIVIIMEMMKSERLCTAIEASLALGGDAAREKGCPALVQKAMPFGSTLHRRERTDRKTIVSATPRTRRYR